VARLGPSNFIGERPLIGVKRIGRQCPPSAFHTLLGQISVEEHEAGRGMLSVLVVHKSGDFRPGTGFFDLARLLGHKSRDRDKVWSEDFKKVKAAWKTPA
jgi:hypothetical protein